MKTRMLQKTALVAAMLGAGLAGLPLTASADLSTGDSVGTTEQEIRASLQSLGYVVSEIEFEEDEIEAEVTLQGVEFEIEIDPATGQITEVEEED